MLKLKQILVNSIVLAGGTAALMVLSGCGQKGPLFLPTDAAGAQRATLVETLTPAPLTPTQTTTNTSAPGQQLPPNELLMPPAATPARPAASSP
jgi:predicted small lipoprotein YifL